MESDRFMRKLVVLSHLSNLFSTRHIECIIILYQSFCVLAGALLYLLDVFCNSTNPAVREKAAEIFAKMLNDKLVGPRCRIVLSKFLPGIFMDAMRDSPETAVHMFEGRLYRFNGWMLIVILMAVSFSHSTAISSFIQ